MAIEFKEAIDVADDIKVDGTSLGTNAFTNTTIPTNNNQLTNGAGYVTSSGNTVIGTNSNISTPTSTVIDTVTLSSGVVTGFTTRTLTLANIGFTGASNANYITNNNQLTNGAGYITTSSIGNGSITITAGTNLSGGGSFSVNQGSAQTIKIDNSLTNNNQLTNGANYVTGTGTTAKIVMSNGTAAIQDSAISQSGAGFFQFTQYTATAVAANTSVSPNQNAQASSADTLAHLAVDTSGNVVRGDQEATISFTAAQINSGFGGSGLTLITAAGSGKYVVVLDTTYLLTQTAQFTPTGSVGFELRQNNQVGNAAIISVFNSSQFQTISRQGGGIQSRDVPLTQRPYKANQVTTIHKIGSGTVPTTLTSMKVKIRYRVYDNSTF